MKLWLVFLFLILGACGNPPMEPLAPDAVILAFGDSLTFGTGASEDTAYPAVLAELTGFEVINAGVPGEVSAKGRARLTSSLSMHRPSLVILVHGGNDTLRKLPPDETRANIAAMIDQSREMGAQVLMLGVPGRNLTLSTPDYYREIADIKNVPIDASTISRLMRDRSMKSDAVHFNAQGYRAMAIAVQGLMKSVGLIP